MAQSMNLLLSSDDLMADENTPPPQCVLQTPFSPLIASSSHPRKTPALQTPFYPLQTPSCPLPSSFAKKVVPSSMQVERPSSMSRDPLASLPTKALPLSKEAMLSQHITPSFHLPPLSSSHHSTASLDDSTYESQPLARLQSTIQFLHASIEGYCRQTLAQERTTRDTLTECVEASAKQQATSLKEEIAAMLREHHAAFLQHTPADNAQLAHMDALLTKMNDMMQRHVENASSASLLPITELMKDMLPRLTQSDTAPLSTIAQGVETLQRVMHDCHSSLQSWQEKASDQEKALHVASDALAQSSRIHSRHLTFLQRLLEKKQKKTKALPIQKRPIVPTLHRSGKVTKEVLTSPLYRRHKSVSRRSVAAATPISNERAHGRTRHAVFRSTPHRVQVDPFAA